MASVGGTDPGPMDEAASSPADHGTPVRTANKSWSELLHAVKESKKLQSSLVSRVPSNFTLVSTDSDDGRFTRVYFTAIPQSRLREQTLLYVDITTEQESTDISVPEWKNVLDRFHHVSPYTYYSKEEQLLRERKRMGSLGITSYDYDYATCRLAFPAHGTLFDCQIPATETDPVTARDLKGSCSGSLLDPKICPTFGELVAFVCNNDVWVSHATSGVVTRLNNSHYDFRDNPISCGVPSFVTQEEFNRYTGLFWQPVRPDNVFRILVEEVDESDVDVFHIVSPNSDTDTSGVDEYRYPRAGSSNAKSQIKILEFRIESEGQEIRVHSIAKKRLSERLSSLFPWMEYVVRMDWTPCGNYIWVQLLDRPQQRLEVVLLTLKSFVEETTDDSVDVSALTSVQRMPYKVIYKETSTVWVSVTDVLHFLPQVRSDVLSFIWASEDTGFMHLYKVSTDIGALQGKYSDPEVNTYQREQDCQCPTITSKLTLTRGQWPVAKIPITVDEERQLVFFTGYKDTPMESHLYVVSYENPEECKRLTEPNYSHTVTMNPDCGSFVSVYSNVLEPVSAAVFRIEYSTDGAHVTRTTNCGFLLKKSASSGYIAPDIISYHNDVGQDMYAMVYKPHNYEPGRIYPTIQFVYAGPEVQMVNNTFKGLRYIRLHMYAALGYAVIVVDGRGSTNRGCAFESYIKNRMGTVEVIDQVDGLHHIARELGYIDLTRVAIHGWSYGGYMSLMCLAQRPDVYKVSIAGAPVVAWEYYDTGYTERYMDTPSQNPEGYTRGSVLKYANRFPNEENRLLIIHGIIDENVHFYHTSKLIDCLIKACKPYQLQVYPSERHGIRNPESNEHFETSTLSFLQRNL